MKKFKAKSKTKKILKGILIGAVVVTLISLFTTLFVKLDRQTTTTKIGGEAYSIGAIDVDTGDVLETSTSIYLRKAVTIDGLKCELAEDAKITYQLFFFNEDGDFLAATDVLTSDFDGNVPDGAESVKIVITPTEDDNVTLTEVLGYAGQLTVRVNR